MGKIVETTKKKKKGRPSLLDLQKRSLREQQEQNQQQQRKLKEPNPNPNPNPNPSPNNPNRRSTRRNPKLDVISPEQEIIRAGEEEGEEEEEEDDDDESNGRRREKKLKLVLRLPPHQQNQRSSANANASVLNSASGGGSDSNSEDENGDAPLKRRKINAVGDRSGIGDGGEGEKLNTASKTIDSLSGKPMESGPRTPLPDKKLLVFILDRLQKKDTYGVYSEPVDPKELPDYHDIIEHPMDFGTVRNKLSSGAYAYLEQFEKDVFLICSNAMRYNASDTIYFRQARTIQELAKKNFENLRQDSDDNEPEPKIVRRGRPPTKNLKKPLGRPPLDRASSEFSSDATLANGGDSTIWSNSYDLRKGSFSEKSGSADLSGRTLNGSRNSEERKSERNDEFPATMSKNFSTKFGKKQLVFDENRRNTYKQFLASVGHEQSVLGTFDGQKKQLMAVGLHTEHGFARSLARFAADLGPIVWKIASKKIERALPAQMMFGPGWVGVKEPPLSRPSIVTPFPAQSLIPQQHISLPKVSSTTVPCISDSKADKFSEKQEPSNNSTSDAHSNRTTSPPSMNVSSSSAVASKSCEPTSRGFEPARELNCESGFNVLRSTPAGVKPVPPFQIHQRPLLNSGMNGFRGSFGFDLASQMAKFVRPSFQVGGFSSETSMRPQALDVVSRSNSNFVQPTMPVSHSDSEYRRLPEGPSTVNSATSLVDSGQEASRVQPQSTLQGLSRHQKIESVPPDLNVRFQSPGSPSCTQQPDLALQLQL